MRVVSRGLWGHARIWPLHLQPGQLFDCTCIHALSDLCSTFKLMDSPLIQVFGLNGTVQGQNPLGS